MSWKIRVSQVSSRADGNHRRRASNIEDVSEWRLNHVRASNLKNDPRLSSGGHDMAKRRRASNYEQTNSFSSVSSNSDVPEIRMETKSSRKSVDAKTPRKSFEAVTPRKSVEAKTPRKSVTEIRTEAKTPRKSVGDGTPSSHRAYPSVVDMLDERKDFSEAQLRKKRNDLFQNFPQFFKHCRRGPPHIRDVTVNVKTGQISWGKSVWKSESIHNLQAILPGKQTLVFKRVQAETAPELRCFSLKFPTRTLDLEALSSKQARAWIWAIEHLQDEIREGAQDDFESDN